MPSDPRAADLHGLRRLAVHGVAETAGLVEQMHSVIARIGAPIGTHTSRTPHGQTRGIVGDHLAATGNPLAIPMRLCHQGRSLDLDESAIASTVAKPARRLLADLHGLCMSDHCWLSDNGTPHHGIQTIRQRKIDDAH